MGLASPGAPLQVSSLIKDLSRVPTQEQSRGPRWLCFQLHSEHPGFGTGKQWAHGELRKHGQGGPILSPARRA